MRFPGFYFSAMGLVLATLSQSGFSQGVSEKLDDQIVAAIASATKIGSSYTVLTRNYEYGGQILKADTLVLGENTNLILTNATAPWIAIVAKTLQITNPEVQTKLIYQPDWAPRIHKVPDPPPTPGQQYKSGLGADGPSGRSGTTGLPGYKGDDAPKTPVIYVMAESIVDSTGKPIPEMLNFVIDVRGQNGGDASDGGLGGNGGQGGDGGDGDYHSPSSYPFNSGCVASAGAGGAGGVGGQGGKGNLGGNGSSGATLYFVGPKAVIDSLGFARVYNQPGFSGKGSSSGASGATGPAGARGAHPGTCRGGTTPLPQPVTSSTPKVKAADGKKGDRGSVREITRDTVSDLL